ncbi:MAG TPA: T6SS effector amidase Tae4 family protein [Candidatus Angelobacter sp.]|jgi:hypothetical protein|nr:T6SS effector amidase Tae4 family protein [Candidatus Angelobacter sp.]
MAMEMVRQPMPAVTPTNTTGTTFRAQRKLAVGGANDPLEHEADCVANQVMGMRPPDIFTSQPPPRLDRQRAGFVANEVPGVVHDVLGSVGRPLETSTRAFMEPRFGHDFSHVRVHDDASASFSAHAIGARAYTVGKDLVFARNEYAPASRAGRQLLAHELTHVVQQRESGGFAVQRAPAGPSVTGASPLANPPKTRPASGSIWKSYSQVSYDVWYGRGNVHEVWKFIGGSVGKLFDGQDTCAARVSWALNGGGSPIPYKQSIPSFHNWSNTTFEGKAGDDNNYIVGAPAMQTYLATLFGAPDAQMQNPGDASDFEKTLAADQCALFAGADHSGLIKDKGYSDPYVNTDRGVLPVDAWKLA